MKTKRLIFTVISGVAVLAVMVTIFVFSNQKGETSSAASNSAGSFILDLLNIEVPEGQSPDTVPIVFDFTIRNLAHIFLFSCLGLTSYLFCLSLLAERKAAGRGLKGPRRHALISAAMAFGFSLFYACCDELHQMFIGGRSATIRDVGIDAIGFTLAIGLGLAVTALTEYLYCRKIAKKQREK